MKPRHLLTRPLKKLLASRGFIVTRPGFLPERLTMNGAVKALARRGVRVNTVVDIGASTGEWTIPCMEHFPESSYLLIEAQTVHEPALKAVQAAHSNVHVVLAAAGREQGSIYFDVKEPMGGQASYTPYETDNAVVPMTTVDHEVARLGLLPPYLLKFDTHGFEVPILDGAVNTLAETVAIVMECYNFRQGPDGLLFYEMCDVLARRGFRVLDLASPAHRPHDDALWQMDLVFVRETRPEFLYPRYD